MVCNLPLIVIISLLRECEKTISVCTRQLPQFHLLYDMHTVLRRNFCSISYRSVSWIVRKDRQGWAIGGCSGSWLNSTLSIVSGSWGHILQVQDLQKTNWSEEVLSWLMSKFKCGGSWTCRGIVHVSQVMVLVDTSHVACVFIGRSGKPLVCLLYAHVSFPTSNGHTPRFIAHLKRPAAAIQYLHTTL